MWVLSLQMQPDEEGKTKHSRRSVRRLLDTGKQRRTTRKKSGGVASLPLHPPSERLCQASANGGHVLQVEALGGGEGSRSVCRRSWLSCSQTRCAWSLATPSLCGGLWCRCGSLRWHVPSRDRPDGRSWNTLAATPNTCVLMRVTPRCNAAERNARTLHLQPSRQSRTHTGSTTHYAASVFLSARNEVFIKRMENSERKQ